MIKGVRTLKYGEIIPVMGEIFREGETGTLLLQNDPAAKYLYFQNGQVIFAASNAPEDKFTQILLEEGKLKEEQLDMAMQKKGNRTIAKTLTEMGFISSQDLLASLIMQVYRVASSVISWTEGTASFKPDVLPQGVAKLPMSTQRLILDLVLSIDNRPWALQVVGGMDKVISIDKAEMDVALALPLQPEEEKVVRFCDGKRNIETVAAGAGSDPFKAIKLLIGLHMIGLAHPKRGVEAVTHQPTASAPQHEDKHLDLSFLETALPGKQEQPAPFELETPKSPGSFLPEPAPAASEFQKPQAPEPAAPLKFEEPQAPEFKVEKIEEPQPEPPREVIQQPLFQPSFLPAEEQRIGEIKENSEPRVILPPPNPIPKRSSKWGKVVLPLCVMAGLTLAFYVIYVFFIADKENHLPPPQPPKAVPKKIAAQAEKPVPAGNATIKEENPASQAAPPTTKPAETEPAPLKPEKIESVRIEPPPAQEPQKTEAKKPEPPPAKEPEKPPVKEEAAPSGDPSASLRSGEFEKAAAGFKKIYGAKKGGYTIALMIACEKETLQKSFAGSGESDDFIIFPHNFKGRSCYRVVWGYFTSRAEAEAAYSKLPSMFKDSGAKIVPFDSMKP